MILVVIPAVLVAVMSLASFAGAWVWWLDVLANFRAQYVVILAVLGLVIAAGRWPRTGFAIMGVALLNLAFVAPLFVGSPGEPVAGAPGMRVMSFNLLSTNESYSEVIEYIEATSPDIVLLHESSRPWEVAMESSGLDYEIVRGRSDDLIFGTLVLARGDVEAVSYGFAEGDGRAISMVYQPEGWPASVQILSSHPLAPTSGERAALPRRPVVVRGRLGGRAGRCVSRCRGPQRLALVLSVSRARLRRRAAQLTDRIRPPAIVLGSDHPAVPGPDRPSAP